MNELHRAGSLNQISWVPGDLCRGHSTQVNPSTHFCTYRVRMQIVRTEIFTSWSYQEVIHGEPELFLVLSKHLNFLNNINATVRNLMKKPWVTWPCLPCAIGGVLIVAFDIFCCCYCCCCWEVPTRITQICLLRTNKPFANVFPGNDYSSPYPAQLVQHRHDISECLNEYCTMETLTLDTNSKLIQNLLTL